MMRLKHFLVFTFSIMMTLSSIAQADTSFYKTYTGGPFDVGQGIVQLPDNSYAVTGSSSSFSDPSSQAFIMIIDSAGNQQWTRSFGGNESDWGRRIFHKEGEGFWVAGYSNSYSAQGDYDMVLYKLNEEGQLEWAQPYGNENWERLWDAKQLDDDSFILVGEAEGIHAQGKDIFIVRAAPNGDTLWTKTISTPYDDVAYAVEILNDSTLVLGGEQHTENDEYKGYLLELSFDAEIVNEWTTNEHGPTVFKDVHVYNNDIYAIGFFFNEPTNSKNTLFLRLNSNYEELAAEVGNTNGDDLGTNILILGNSKIYWTLKSRSPDFNVFEGGGWDLFLLRYNIDMLFNNLSLGFSGVNDDEIFQMIATADGGFIMVGTCSDNRQFNSFGSSVMIIKVGPNDEHTTIANQNNDLVSTQTDLIEDAKIAVYPNPFYDELYFENISTSSLIHITDSSGKIIHSGEVPTSNKINLSHLPKGLYFLSINNTNSALTFKVIKE